MSFVIKNIAAMKNHISSKYIRSTFLLLLFIFSKLFAQSNSHLGTADTKQPNWLIANPNGDVYITGSRIDLNNILIMSGFPYFISEWIKGIVVFKSGKQYHEGDLQFDWIKNEIHFRNNGESNLFADSIKQILLFDSTIETQKLVDFRNGYPAVGHQTLASFYEVVASGKNFQLLRYWKINSREVYEYGGAYMKVYSKVADWYVYNIKAVQLKPITLKPESVQAALPSNTRVVQQLSTTKNSKKLSEVTLIALIDSLNSH